MAKTLVIVESPTKARTIERFLKSGYEVLASYGYVRDLPGGEEFRQRMNRLESCEEQLAAVDTFYESQMVFGERLQYRLAEQKLAA